MARSKTKKAPFAKILARAPTLEEFAGLIDAVGWSRYTNTGTLTKALANSLFCVVAVHRNKVIGAGRLVGDGVRNIHVQDIMVLPEFQRRGVGTAIMDRLMDYIYDEAPSKTYIHLFTEKKNSAFYARYGFKGPEESFYGMSVKKFDQRLGRKDRRKTSGQSAAARAEARPAAKPGTVPPSKLTGIRCVLAVNDLEKSTGFYREKLGFKVDFTADGWSFLSRGEFKLMLGHCPDEGPAREIGDHSWFAYVDVEKIEDLYQECKGNGVEILEDIADKPYGMREFGIVTPDGHRIVFGQPRG